MRVVGLFARPAMVGAVKVALVIPAAGSGARLGRGVPKALVDVGGVPLLRVTLERLSKALPFAETLVLAPPGEVAEFEGLLVGVCASLGRVRVFEGGATRQLSVANGLGALSDSIDIVCVHDAARPLVSVATVRAVIEAAGREGASTAASRPSDSVREDRPGGGSGPLDRSRLWLVETPQAFRRNVLVAGHREAAKARLAYTDDASLVEAVGQSVRIVETIGRNLKVTVEADLRLAAELLKDT